MVFGTRPSAGAVARRSAAASRLHERRRARASRAALRACLRHLGALSAPDPVGTFPVQQRAIHQKECVEPFDCDPDAEQLSTDCAGDDRLRQAGIV